VTEIHVVADAGPRAGLGHLSRSTALVVALRCHGRRVLPRLNGVGEPLERDGVAWEPLGDGPLEEGDVVVIDSYLLDRAQIEACAARRPVVVFHDGGRTAPPAGSALVVSVGGQSPGALTGPAWACLRPMFWGVPAAPIRPRVERILVAVGGGIVAGGSALAADIAARLPEARVRFVVGPYSDEDRPAGVEIVEAPDELLSEFRAADLVVTAAGQTMLEALAVGVPCVAVAVVDNQRAQLARLQETGAVRAATPDDAADLAAQLAANPGAREAMGATARATVDSFGALRLAWRIADLAG
jgi:spore coat polysaccharide biosynthesis predicted glycosyltransferase SpsG